jgi:hypothetical protein
MPKDRDDHKRITETAIGKKLKESLDAETPPASDRMEELLKRIEQADKEKPKKRQS